MSVTSYPFYWSYLKTFFQLFTCLCTSDKLPKRQCLSFRHCNDHICIPDINLDDHIILCKLVCSTVTAGFTEWHRGFSKMLFEHNLHWNTRWYSLSAGQHNSVIRQRQFTLFARVRGANQNRNVDRVSLCIFTFHILLYLLKWYQRQNVIFHIITPPPKENCIHGIECVI